ncbi:hypothetical protein KY312_03235 [Candidatus Woesearchaeota archaeon]|nr:hypothetical protein [Candidatus Woesearchaeota archaeon]
MGTHKIKLRNEDLIRLILQINERLEAKTVDELISLLEDGKELDLNVVVKTNVQLKT